MKTQKLISAAMVFGTVLAAAAPSYAQLATRCFQDDQLSAAQASGRNAWSRKCGYISASAESYLNSEGMYQVYQNGCVAYPNIPAGSTCNRYVPVSSTAACIYGLVKLGTCYAGCYTAKQEVAFSDRYVPIMEAYDHGAETVTALKDGSSADEFFFDEQPIRTFIAGDTSEPIFLLETRDGRRVEVTAEHPMITDRGDVVKARTLQVGDMLLGDDGSVLELSSVTTFPFVGKVWNVQPKSHVKIENVLKAQGFLTGSVRFQNEWSEESYRLGQRDEVDVKKL